MPKLTLSVPKYRKHKASGQAVVTLDGKDHYLGPHGSKTTIAEYDRLVAEYLVNGRSIPQPSNEPIRVVQLILRYWRFAEKYYVKNGKPTKELYAIKTVLRPVKTLYGREPAMEFGPLALKAVRQEWISAGHARKTINKNVQRVIRVFRWAASEELIPGSIPQALATVEGLKRGRTEARESAPVLPIDLKTVDATMQHLCPVVQDMIRLQLLTGMRPSEVCGIRPRDIDRSGDVWEYRPQGHKTEHHERQRVVCIGPEGQRVLTTYLDRHEDQSCFSPIEAVNRHRASRHANRVTPLHHGNRPGHCSSGLKGKRAARLPGAFYTTDSYRRAIHRACDRAFPPEESLVGDALKIWKADHRWSPNRLRHTKGTEVRRKFGLEAAQVVLGHSVANVTEIYAERDVEKAREVARKIG